MISTLRKLKEELRDSVIEKSEIKIEKEKKLHKQGKISDEEFVKFCDNNTKETANKLKEEIEKIKNAENLTGNDISTLIIRQLKAQLSEYFITVVNHDYYQTYINK